ncbi:hypothetical protein C8R41DRAFT_831517 [Lentinula lateritia]|uniref:Uncharacterized protein n=1 Tax=Lentinula lateritia TaxID=40482 RepID=A0ABQ8VFM8_9AGAR|nr:hypothetical protein C8R41DRAFT_831517 [Lentinula lateritia]
MTGDLLSDTTIPRTTSFNEVVTEDFSTVVTSACRLAVHSQFMTGRELLAARSATPALLFPSKTDKRTWNRSSASSNIENLFRTSYLSRSIVHVI